MIYSSPRSAILKNEYPSKDKVYLHSKLVVEKESLKSMVEEGNNVVMFCTGDKAEQLVLMFLC